MHMVTLNSQVKNLPIMLICNFMDDLLKPTGHRAIEDLPPSPWTPENMVHHQMDGMGIVNIVHVYGLPYIDTLVKRRTQKSPCALAPNKVGQFIPRIHDGGFPGRGSVRNPDRGCPESHITMIKSPLSEETKNTPISY
jgi:hypothetical protein